jgi:hypothetical protein
LQSELKLSINMHVAVEAEFVLPVKMFSGISLLCCIETCWVRSAFCHTLQFWCRGAINASTFHSLQNKIFDADCGTQSNSQRVGCVKRY